MTKNLKMQLALDVEEDETIIFENKESIFSEESESANAVGGSDDEDDLSSLLSASEENDDLSSVLDAPLTDKRVTFPILTLYEQVMLLGVRIQQIIHGASVLVPHSKDMKPAEIAELELKNRVLPFRIRRVLPNGSCEVWDLKELILLHIC